MPMIVDQLDLPTNAGNVLLYKNKREKATHVWGMTMSDHTCKR